MRLRKLGFRGLTRFTDSEPVLIEFDSPGLLALVGENGAGKTTALEAVAVALYKKFPSRPGFYENFSGRDAFVHAVFDDRGKSLEVRVTVDAERRTCESYVFEDGSPLTDGKAASFDAVVRERFGSSDLFLSSVFAAQNKAGSFLSMPKGGRKALFAELLQLGRLEELAADARARRQSADSDLVRLRESIASLSRETEPLPGLEEDLAGLSSALDSLAGTLRTAREEEHAATAAVERARGAREQLRALEAAEGSARAALSAAERALTAARDRIPQANRRHNEAIGSIEARSLQAQRSRQDAEDRYQATEKRIREQREKLEAVLSREAEIRDAEKEVRELEREEALILAAMKEHESAVVRRTSAEHDVDLAAERMENWKQQRAREIDTLRLQMELLDAVPCTAAPEWVCEPGGLDGVDLAETCPLLANARKSRAAVAELEGALVPESLRLAVESATAALREAEDNCKALSQNAEVRRARLHLIQVEDLPRAGGIAVLASALAGARDAMGSLTQQQAEAVTALTSGRGQSDEALRRLADERVGAEERLAEETADARQEIAEREAEAEEARKRHLSASLALETARRNLVAGDEASSLATLAERRKAREDAERALSEATAKKATVEERIRHLRERLDVLEKEQLRVEFAEREVGDWRALEEALGQNGVQALEIDAAGPEVARLTNELLEATYGPRFSLQFETLREKKSKAGEFSEVFDVRVFDGGAERQVEALSGGERVVVGEALGLALSIFNARKSGIRWETLFRDETAGALDPENASRYVSMLRRALELGGFSQCVFIAHLPAVYESADVQVLIEGGRVDFAVVN